MLVLFWLLYLYPTKIRCYAQIEMRLILTDESILLQLFVCTN